MPRGELVRTDVTSSTILQDASSISLASKYAVARLEVSLAASRNWQSLGSVCSRPWYSMKRTAPPSPTPPPSRRTKHRNSALGPGSACGRCALAQWTSAQGFQQVSQAAAHMATAEPVAAALQGTVQVTAGLCKRVSDMNSQSLRSTAAARSTPATPAAAAPWEQ